MPFVGNIGAGELILVLIIALIVVGPKKLPDVARSVGTGMREFKESITGKDRDRDEDDDDDVERPKARREVEAALGRPEGEQAPLDAERERSPR